MAALTASDVELLIKDASIIRNRAKIEATIHNARLLAAVSLADIAWKHQPQQHYWLRTWNDGRMNSPESRGLATHLKSVGFRFVGPVVAHSFMQTVGIENGKDTSTARSRAAVESAP